MIGNKTFHLLRSMGVSTIETLSSIPVDMMERLLGKNGIIIGEAFTVIIIVSDAGLVQLFASVTVNE